MRIPRLRLDWLALTACFMAAPLAAQTPNTDDLNAVPGVAQAARRPSPEVENVIQLSLQTGGSPFDSKALDAEGIARLGAEFRDRVQLILTDPAIQALATRVSTVWPGKPKRLSVVLSGTESGAYFNHSFIVLGRGTMGGPPGQVDNSPRARTRRREAFKSTVLHELGHFLQCRLYSEWLPNVNYKSTEFSNSESGEHWFDKETSPSSAWCEGFAEAVSAFLGADARIENFRHRRAIFYGIREPRALGRLAAIEGHVAFMLHDFWQPKGQTAAFDRTLDVLRLSDYSASKRERHSTFDAYLTEHMERFPDDAIRWELVVRANSLLRDGVGHRGMALPPAVRATLEAIGAGLEGLAARSGDNGADRTAQAVAALLASGSALPSNAASVIAAVRTQMQKLIAAGRPVFEVADSGGDEYEQMPIAQLEKAVENAKGDAESWFRHYGYDFHPKVQDAKTRHQRLQAILTRRRSGR